MQNNKELDLAWEFINYTRQNIYLTGKAGTGKTTFLKRLKESGFKRMAVVAPTGVAAINAGGVTIHSFFQLPFGPILPTNKTDKHTKGPFNQRFNRQKIDIIRSLDLLVIDEISMVRADLLDGIDTVLRRYRNRTMPFGGVQLLFIGDLQQLPPVVKNEEQYLLEQHYESLFFFGSHAYQSAQVLCIELKKVYRQSDEKFIRILNEVRENKLSSSSLSLLNERYIIGFQPQKSEGYIHLTTHNAAADRINSREMELLPAEANVFEAEVAGHFPESAYPTHFRLQLKKGAQVMFVRNDSSYEKRFYNGKIGTVVRMNKEEVIVRCPGDDADIIVEKTLWNNIRYELDDKTKEMEEKIEGSFLQFPLRLAWAITIHKSQGLTFEHAIIDAQSAFAHGQTYVALSRCKSLEGLVLSSSLSGKAIISDSQVNRFSQQAEANAPDEQQLSLARKSYQLTLLHELFNFKPLEYQLQKVLGATHDSENSLIGNLPDTILKLEQFCSRELVVIGDKFIRQIQSLMNARTDVETNPELNERLVKASGYFTGIITQSWTPVLAELQYDTDNHALMKELRERLGKIKGIMSVKQSCLEACSKGFKTAEFIAVRAKALLQADESKTRPQPSKAPVSTSNPELYQALSKWRRNQAENNHLKAYQILTQKSLMAITELLPTNPKELLKISGVGKKTVEKFGTQILKIISLFVEDKGLEIEVQSEIILEPKLSTYEKTMALIREGKTIAEMARIRGISQSTVESHIARYLESGDLDINDWMDKKTLTTISDHLEQHPKQGLKDVKEALGDTISYGNLKMVMAWMKGHG